MGRHSKALAVLTFAVAVAVGGFILPRQVIAVAGEADAERLNRAILEYIAEKNPRARIKASQKLPDVLLAEAGRARMNPPPATATANVRTASALLCLPIWFLLQFQPRNLRSDERGKGKTV